MDAYGSAVRAARCAAITARRGGLWRLCWGTAVDKRAFHDTIRATESTALRAAEKIMDAGVREAQSKLAMIRRELKRRKRTAGDG